MRISIALYLTVILLCMTVPVRAADLAVSYDRGKLSLSADEVPLTEVLDALASRTGVTFTFPANLADTVTIELVETPLTEGLHRLLNGHNVTFLHAYSQTRDAVVVAEVRIYGRQLSPRQQRLQSQVTRFEKLIAQQRRQLATTDETSRKGKAILRRIKSYQRQIERLERRADR